MILQLAIAYLVGSIPFGLVLTKLAGYGDIRNIGSGNIGATNVLRTGNKKLALATLLLDAVKGAAVIIILTAIFGYSKPLLLGLAAVLGHCFPVWLKFKGGKGVATALGTLLVAAPLSGLAACLTWLLSAAGSKISSLAAISAMLIAPVFTLIIYGTEAALVNAAISALVIIRHKDNIARIRKGTEPRIGAKKHDQTVQKSP